MNFKKLLIILLISKDIFSFKLVKNIKKNNIIMCSNENKIQTPNKFNSYLKLIRYKNILPTMILSFSGNFISSQNKFIFLNNIPSTIVTILTMSYSMIINDIFDIKIDKINNPKRPLVTGEISLYEALTLIVIIIKLIDNISFYYLPINLQNILKIVIITLSLYTPFFKKMPLVKNLVCSFIISFTLFFSGLSINNVIINKQILFIASVYVFLGALVNELLLDIVDHTGDLQNKIQTIPVIFGKYKSLKLSANILRFNIFFTSTLLIAIYDFYKAMPIFLFTISYYFRMNNLIKKRYIDNETLINLVKDSNIPFILSLFYLCFLSKIHLFYN